MCGIAGILSPGQEPIDPGLLDRMIGTIGHRGPDERGQYIASPVGLAHARLSIIDVAGGQQPMHSADKALSVTFNGEIFNYLELREDLEQKGHRFATRSDTEVILHLYEEKGEDCVKEFNGQWAFALWDRRRKKLFLSRDRIGVRPLFYAFAGGDLIFGSEIKALLAHPGIGRELDLRGLDQIFTFWAPLAPRTVFKNISALPPGHSLSVDASGRRLYRYWQPDFTTSSEPMDEHECAERLLELLIDATRLRLRSDVPVGAYLSGGLDSTVVTTLVKRFTDNPLRTFSVTFEDAEFDESRYQNEVVDFLRSDHARVRCSTSDIARVFPDVISHAEQPVLRTAPAPLYLLSRLVRENGYKVVLTGEGADEMLGGYDIFKEAKIRQFWAMQPDSRVRPLLLKRLYPYLKNVQSQSDAYLKAFFRIGSDPSGCFFSHLPRWQLTSRLKLLFSDDVRSQLTDVDIYDELKQSLPSDFARWDGFSRAQYLETTVLLPGYILSSQGDRVAMAHAVEGRFPFLDHRVVEFAASLPARLKMKALNEKYVLKLATERLIPEAVRRRSKQPYRAPDAKCFVEPDRAGRWPDYVEDLLDPGRLRADGIFNPAAVGQLVAKARAGQAIGVKDNMGLVGVLSTQLVNHRFIRHSG